MKAKFIWLILCIVAVMTIYPSSGYAVETIKWYSYNEGMSLGKSEQKKVLLTFFADWCGYCTKMEKETFTNPQIISFLNKNFIPIKVNYDKDNKIASRYQVRGLPSTWFFSEDGHQIGSQPGYIPATNLLTILKYIQSDSYKKMSFDDFTKAQK